jgi:Rieske Fe-S protein
VEGDALSEGAKSRRTILRCALAFGAGLALPDLARGQGDAASARPKEGDLLVQVGDAAARPLTAMDIAAGAPPTFAWAMDPADRTVRSASRLNRLLLMRIDPAELSDDTRPLAADGIVAYTTICTHSGCDIDEWLADEHVLYCSCHSSKFDPRSRAKVIDGPAPRSLPALPLKVADGTLVVAGAFTARVGFESA